MTPAQKSKGSTLELVLTFAVLFFVTNWALQFFFPAQFGKKVDPIVSLTAQTRSIAEGGDPILVIANHTAKDMLLPKRCPQPPVDIAYLQLDKNGSGSFVDRMANQTAAYVTSLLGRKVTRLGSRSTGSACSKLLR